MISTLLRHAAAGAALLVGAAGCATSTPAADAARERELLAADRAFAAAAAREGLDGWLRHFAADAVRLDPPDGVARGLAAIRAHDAGLFADPALRLAWEPARAGVFAGGRSGFTVGRYRLVRGDGAETLTTGWYLTWWRKDGAEWRVILDTGGADPPAAAPAGGA